MNLQLFGGRGAGSESRPQGGGGGEGNFSPFGIGETIPEVGKLKQSIGEKGSPYSIDNALKNVNPNHNYSYSEYSENCQRCVVAYELRRRGYKVEALPTYKNDKLPIVNGYGNGNWQKAFRGAKSVKVGASTPKKTQSNLESKMREYGNGSRAVVRIPGHVFNCENVRGKIKYVDAQTGIKYTSNNVFGRLTSSQTKQVQIIRTDNLRISDRARELVKKSKK